MASNTGAVSIVNTGTITPADLYKPEYLPHLKEQFLDEIGGRMFDFYGVYGKNLAVSNEKYSFWQSGRIFQNLKSAGAVGDPGTGNPITFTIDSSDYYDAAGNISSVRIGDQVYFANDVTGVVTAFNKATPFAHTVTVQPNLATDNIGPLTATSHIAIFSGQYDEGSATPDSLAPRFDEVANYVQKISESYKVTEREMATQTWAQMPSRLVTAGVAAPGNFTFIKGSGDTFIRQLNKMELALIVGKNTTNPAVTSTSTLGLWQNVMASGLVRNYTVGSLDIPFWDATVREIDRNGGADEYHVWAGLELRQEITNQIFNDFPNGAIRYASFGDAGSMAKRTPSEMGVALGFTSFEKDGRTFHMITYKQFNHPELLGSSGMKFPRRAIMVPEKYYTDPVSQENVHAMCIRYMEPAKHPPMAGSHRISNGRSLTAGLYQWETGGFAPNGTDDTSTWKINWTWTGGHQAWRINTFVAMEPDV